MESITPYQISCYVDGQLSPEQALAVETALATDQEAAGLCEQLKNLGELFAPSTDSEAAEQLPDEVQQRLYDLDRAESLAGFRAIKLAATRPAWGWGRIGLAAAAVLLLGIGLTQMLYRPEVVVTDLTRQVVDARGSVLRTERLASVTMRAGDPLRARAGERVSCRLPGGVLVVLLPGGSLRIGDPREREAFELDEGMVLCTVAQRTEPCVVHAGGCEIVTDSAHFGVRVAAASARSMGPALAASSDAPYADVAVAVSSGSLRVTRNGMSETVRAGRRIILRRGVPAETSHASQDPLFVHLMRHFKPLGHEILPGFFSSESGVNSIPVHHWAREPDGTRVLTLSGSREAFAAHYLVLYVRASEPMRLAVTRVMPDAARPGLAGTVTIQTEPVGRDWTVVAIPRKAFDAPERELKDRKIPVSRSRLVRLEIRPAVRPDNSSDQATFELKSSLWAPRPPAGNRR